MIFSSSGEMVRRDGEEELDDFFTFTNQFHKTIKFTMKHLKKSISFLDTMVKKSAEGKLYTDLSVKPTDKSNYLQYSSAHPPHCK